MAKKVVDAEELAKENSEHLATLVKLFEILEAKYPFGSVALIPHGSFDTPPLPEFKANDELTRIMTFGKFGTYKKVEELILAVTALRNRGHKNIELVIAGTDSPNNPGYLEGVKQHLYVPMSA